MLGCSEKTFSQIFNSNGDQKLLFPDNRSGLAVIAWAYPTYLRDLCCTISSTPGCRSLRST